MVARDRGRLCWTTTLVSKSSRFKRERFELWTGNFELLRSTRTLMAVKARAAVNLNQPVFKGEAADLLEQVFQLFLKLWEEHYTSPVFAGDEMIFTLGGNGYLLVFSHLGFDTLVEVKTPRGAVELRPNAEAGGVTMAKVEAPEGVPADQLLRDFIAGIQDYYARGPRLRV